MAECHPVAYQWVTEARLKGAKVIHIDPRFTRTSATADKHVPIRAGSDVVFLGALINHILSNELYFRDYVVAYTNAAAIVDEEFVDTEDLAGVFSGLDETKGTYDSSSWQYEGAVEAAAAGQRDPHQAGTPSDAGATSTRWAVTPSIASTARRLASGRRGSVATVARSASVPGMGGRQSTRSTGTAWPATASANMPAPTLTTVGSLTGTLPCSRRSG